MKKLYFFISILFFCNSVHAQWKPILALKQKTFGGEEFVSVSASANKNIWAITVHNTYDFIIYNTSDGGVSWSRIHPKGLAKTFTPKLYAINATTALLTGSEVIGTTVMENIYRTSDSGHSWKKVFSDTSDYEIKPGMFDNNFGLMVAHSNKLYYTIDGGNSWNIDPANPTNENAYVTDFVVVGSQAAMVDGSYSYYSSTAGFLWTKQKTAGSSYLQVEDSTYSLAVSGFNDLFVKRPGKRRWVDEGNPTGCSCLISGLVLDGKECWIAMGFDTRNNYYSSDSAKTFVPFLVDSTKGFVMLTKARKGRNIFAVTPSFGGNTPSQLWVHPRHENVDYVNQNSTIAQSAIKNMSDALLKQTTGLQVASLEQNIPNPFNSATRINYVLPQQYTSAYILVIERSGKVIKQINVSGAGKGSLQIDASTMLPGIYEYSLIVNEKLIDTKQMVLIK